MYVSFKVPIGFGISKISEFIISRFNFEEDTINGIKVERGDIWVLNYNQYEVSIDLFDRSEGYKRNTRYSPTIHDPNSDAYTTHFGGFWGDFLYRLVNP